MHSNIYIYIQYIVHIYIYNIYIYHSNPYGLKACQKSIATHLFKAVGDQNQVGGSAMPLFPSPRCVFLLFKSMYCISGCTDIYMYRYNVYLPNPG